MPGRRAAVLNRARSRRYPARYATSHNISFRTGTQHGTRFGTPSARFAEAEGLAVTPAELRDLFDDESDLHRLTSSAPPLVINIVERTVGDRVWYETWTEEEPADRVGQSLSGELVALIAGIRADAASYGPRHPVRRALSEWERICRRRHRPGPSLQWRDHSAGPICAEMLFAVVHDSSVAYCAERWHVPFPRTERLLLSGLRFVADRLERWQDEQLGLTHDREQCAVCREEAADA